uniref:NADH-ubiquinone oxidoreductase chain 4L n=1 Tax=Laemophloeidae sp. KM-2017 TaxID=2219439 RepID=A0A346RHI0_9CUCU|nr:NADH dehydrogenase subunit 4L [Laemophloeidae sp. KM-2017]
MLMYLYFYMFFSGLFIFSSKRKHLLLMLLSLEFIVLVLYLYMFNYISFNSLDMFFMMIFLTMSVCEGALGLSMLISMIRMHGNDYIMNLTFLW